jgi:hypothetical protein
MNGEKSLKEDICSIPVNEIFEARDGCPFCRMHITFEERFIDFIMGAAMMEPDIRIETNKMGFCSEHYSIMLKKRNRLSIALMLESHLDEVERKLFYKATMPIRSNFKADRAEKAAESCFVCDKINRETERFTDTFFRLYSNEQDFRKLTAEQPLYCLNHYTMLMSKSKTALDKLRYEEFVRDLNKVTHEALKSIKSDVSHFCKMFDYRNCEADWGNSKDAVERAIKFLSGEIN